MNERSSVPSLGRPLAYEVVSVEAAETLINTVHDAIAALERQLEANRRHVEEAGSTRGESAPDAVDAALADELRLLAEQLRTDAEAYAAQAVEEARSRAAAMIAAARPSGGVSLQP